MQGASYLTARDVSQRLGVSGATVRKWIARGWLASYRVGGRVRITWGSYDAFVRAGLQNLPPSANGQHAQAAQAQEAVGS